MKLGPATKLDKKNKITSKNFDDEVMSEDCDVIVIFPEYDQFGVIWKPDYGRIVCKTYVLLWYYFCQKSVIICKKMLTPAKLRGLRY